MSTRHDDLRRALVDLLRAGEITMAEAARLGGVSRQAVGKWCAAAGVDAPSQRDARIKRRLFAKMQALAVGPDRRSSKHRLRNQADEAHVEWQQRKAMNDGDTRP